ncbi:eukaryotic translation initiation factor 2 subunit 2 isoform X2 [Condylostylus longicornis]|uniref:eukaryotic translation initiation factor 2 subunit 2 isoform X2 n=1 Tax=Condylostylus longicornis TaxID=2530218 RepID=UPI00244DA9FC|nr:eukaryotic translation initiation factor 2 subunit 2 isoform X2 [Condylostylus longicornis]
MAEEDAIFDPTLVKKKKKKKTAFDLDAALGLEDSSNTNVAENANTNEESLETGGFGGNELDDNLDLENFGKKKKKKKKTFNLDDLDNALPTNDTNANDGVNEGAVDDVNLEEDVDLDMDFSKTKKKKKKKKDLDELVSEKQEDEKSDEKENVDENSSTWAGSDRDYTYEELLNRVFEIILDKNPDMAGGRKPKFVMRPPQVLRVGTKKTSFANFTDICKTLHRQPKHLLDFLLAELGTSGSMDGNQQLIIKGRFQPKQIENVLRRYIKEYVTCHTCRSPETILQKDTRLFFLQCESCGSRCSVASIKSGFQAVTSKRAAIRAKTA